MPLSTPLHRTSRGHALLYSTPQDISWTGLSLLHSTGHLVDTPLSTPLHRTSRGHAPLYSTPQDISWTRLSGGLLQLWVNTKSAYSKSILFHTRNRPNMILTCILRSLLGAKFLRQSKISQLESHDSSLLYEEFLPLSKELLSMDHTFCPP